MQAYDYMIVFTDELDMQLFLQGGRKRRWCVLRTYTQSEASLDLYLDETKSRYKGSISLDRETNPILIIKNLDKKRKTSKCCYLALKVNKTSYQFATDSFRELKEWCSLIRQAMDNGRSILLCITAIPEAACGSRVW